MRLIGRKLPMSTRWWNLSEKFAILRKILAHVKEDFTEAKGVLSDSIKEFREQLAESRERLAESRRNLAETKRKIAKDWDHICHIVLSLSNFCYQALRDILLDRLSSKVRDANQSWNAAQDKRNQGEIEHAIDLLTRAVHVFRTVGSTEKTVECSKDLFDLYVEIGQEDKALIVCESLIEFLNGRIFDRSLARGYKVEICGIL
jgi:hypothetical protein